MAPRLLVVLLGLQRQGKTLAVAKAAAELRSCWNCAMTAAPPHHTQEHEPIS